MRRKNSRYAKRSEKSVLGSTFLPYAFPLLTDTLMQICF